MQYFFSELLLSTTIAGGLPLARCAGYLSRHAQGESPESRRLQVLARLRFRRERSEQMSLRASKIPAPASCAVARSSRRLRSYARRIAWPVRRRPKGASRRSSCASRWVARGRSTTAQPPHALRRARHRAATSQRQAPAAWAAAFTPFSPPSPAGAALMSDGMPLH